MFALILGMCIGKWVVHGWFFCEKLKLKIFTEDGQGSWMVMFLISLLSLFIFSFAYNGFLMLEGKKHLFNLILQSPSLILLCEHGSLCQEDWRVSWLVNTNSGRRQMLVLAKILTILTGAFYWG